MKQVSERAQSEAGWEAERLQIRESLRLRMKSARHALGLTLEAAAARSGLAVSTIHKIESRRVSPSYENIIRIARGRTVVKKRCLSYQGALSWSNSLTHPWYWRSAIVPISTVR